MRRYLVFATVGVSLFLASVNITSGAVALPVIISDFNASLALAGWVLSVYQLIALSAMPVAARMSEVFGRKFTFILCSALFTVASILCSLAPNIIWLIIFRAIQAAGGGGFLPSAAGIVADEFPDMRQRAVGLFSSIFPIGSIVGPNLGGWMVSALGWKSIFWFNVPFGVVMLIAAQILLRPKDGKSAKGIDWVGAALLVGFLTFFMLAITELGDSRGIPWLLIALLLIAGIGVLFAFLRREQRVAEPIINLDLLRQKPFLAANVYNFVYGACAMGVFSLIPLYAVSIYNASILESGLILTPRSVAMMAASTVTSFYLVRWGYRRPMLVGTLVVLLSLVLLALGSPEGGLGGVGLSAVAMLTIIISISGIGVGISAPAANNACIELMPDRVATITGMRGMFRQMGGAIAINIGTLLLESIADMRRAFLIIFVGLALVMLLSLPSIFAMPSCPEAGPFQTSQE